MRPRSQTKSNWRNEDYLQNVLVKVTKAYINTLSHNLVILKKYLYLVYAYKRSYGSFQKWNDINSSKTFSTDRPLR